MPLRVAPCPQCAQPLVFGERECRHCGQGFDYGARNPPEPSFMQVVEALRAAGHRPPSLDEPEPPRRPAPAPTAPRPAPHPRSIPSGAPVEDTPPRRDPPMMEGLDTGRFAATGDVVPDDIPGLQDSSLFRAFTPDKVNVAPVAGLDTGRLESVGEVRVQRVQDVETTAKDKVGEVETQDVPGIFHSDFLRAPDVPLRIDRVDGLEPSTRAASPAKAKAGKIDRTGETAGQKKRRIADRDEALTPTLCPCGTTHRLPRCPSCGTAHKDAVD